jgi:hypothetical protein
MALYCVPCNHRVAHWKNTGALPCTKEENSDRKDGCGWVNFIRACMVHPPQVLRSGRLKVLSPPPSCQDRIKSPHILCQLHSPWGKHMSIQLGNCFGQYSCARLLWTIFEWKAGGSQRQQDSGSTRLRHFNKGDPQIGPFDGRWGPRRWQPLGSH